MKHECKRLQEETEDLHVQLEEMTGLRRIVEKNLEEALNNLQAEREQKHALKKELDQRLNRESMFNLSNLARFSGLSEGLSVSSSAFSNNHHESSQDSGAEEDGEGQDHAHPALKRIEADFSFTKKDGQAPPTPRPGVVGDILSEIQVGLGDMGSGVVSHLDPLMYLFCVGLVYAFVCVKTEECKKGV